MVVCQSTAPAELRLCVKDDTKLEEHTSTVIAKAHTSLLSVGLPPWLLAMLSMTSGAIHLRAPERGEE